MRTMLCGLAQINLSASDVAAARDWYSSLLGIEPYLQRPDGVNPAYVEFRAGEEEDELGIIDRRHVPGTAAMVGGVIARCHVEDLPSTMQRLLQSGAREHEPTTEREGGFSTGSVVDPFGYILGLIHSPHYRERRAAGRGGTEA